MLKERINKEFTQAFKDKNIFKKDTLGLLKSKITELEKKDNKEATDDKIILVISNAIKQREQAIDLYNKNNSEQAKLNAQKEMDEIVILESFLPPKLSEEEIKKEIQIVLSKIENTPENRFVNHTGVVMKHFSSLYPGRYNSSVVVSILISIVEDKK